jgi:hypothetical protein
MKSCSAEPSRVNSGQETTANSTGSGWLRLMMSATQSPVPTGTVLLLMTMSGFFMVLATDSAAMRTYCRSASPSTPLGVPTQMKIYSAPASASS